MMYNSDILTAQTQDELEKVCMSAQLSMRADMEHMVMTAVREAYEKGYKDGKKDASDYVNTYENAYMYGIID